MTKRIYLAVIVLMGAALIYLLVGKPATHESSMVERDQRDLSYPRRIILNLTESPSRSMAVNWQAGPESDRGYVQYTEARVYPAFEETLTTLPAKAETITYQDHDLRKDTTLKFFSASIRNLAPGTLYLYRVGDSTSWSEWLQFRTAAMDNQAFSFLYFGDAQNDIKSKWSRVIRQAYQTCPKAGFMYHAGDLINRSHSTREWDDWFRAGGFIHAMIPSVMTPGNHEYKDMILDPQWKAQFHLPENGPEGLEEQVYFSDYQNLRIISLDADMMDESRSSLRTQREWLEEILKSNTQQWTVLTLHFPIYSTKENRDNKEIRNNIQPLIDQYGVDLVLTGHDHAYGRGMHEIQSSLPGRESNTMYVVSVSGPKMYDISDKSWMKKKAGNTQLYQVIEVNRDTLSFNAYTATGERFDAFRLVKDPKGKNQLIEML